MKTRRLIVQLSLMAAFGLSVLIAIAIFVKRPSAPPLPDLQDIAAIDASSFYDARQRREVAFVVPPSHFKSVLDALKPFEADSNPANWVVLGSLEITLKNGQPFHVSLYNVHGSPGAFSSGKSFQSRRYYRGGDSIALETAMAAALDATAKMLPDTQDGRP